MSTFYIHTLGCPKNTVDSDVLKKKLTEAGFYPASTPEEASLVLINTCGFIDAAKEESVEEILSYVEKKSPEQKLIVFGCLAKRYLKELKKELPEVDAFFGVEDFKNILQYCKRFLNGRKPERVDFVGANDLSSYAYIKIAEGCNRRCSFCVIPSIRGRLRSLSQKEIIKRAKELIIKGVKEIILVAQDITSYGKDLGGYSLSNLLYELNSLDGDFWIRLLYLFPDSINEGLIDAIKNNPRVCHYIDMPLQHSEDRILKLMNRPCSKRQIQETIKTIRQEIPDIVLRTAFIVGFPSETEQEFEALLNFIKEVQFDRVGAFLYSQEEGTPAFDLKDQIPDELKKDRYHRLMSIQAGISLEKNLRLVGKRLRVLVDEIDQDVALCRYYGQAPEIDGLVFIKGLRRPLMKGDFVDVTITRAYDYDLEAELN
ncbi:MAG: 30S ribosomal protein S12 methylthiotransferase RimO [Nitrospirae bacterium]|nr:30S ribosomal protein S12 methylthiotransferase RimO [Nitrospirota bacterium]